MRIVQEVNSKSNILVSADKDARNGTTIFITVTPERNEWSSQGPDIEIELSLEVFEELKRQFSVIDYAISNEN